MIVETAPAKINLALHVRAKRPDGYHDLETLFAFLTDGDTITVSSSAVPAFSITGPFADALAGEGDNLVLRAAARFHAVFAGEGTVAITLDKHLPIASGIGGGSADAAATLRALARLRGVAVDDPRLFAIAETLGADVPACLRGTTAIGTGKGEHLIEIGGVTGVPVLLVNPGVPVSTAAVFRAWDGVDRGGLAPGGSVLDRALAGRNDLAGAAADIAPVIGDVVARLSAMPGVVLARMSGSGATCFALFGADEQAHDAATVLAKERPAWWSLVSQLS